MPGGGQPRGPREGRRSTGGERPRAGARRRTGASPWLVATLLVGLGVAAAVTGALVLREPEGPSAPEARLEVADFLAGADTAGFARAVAPRPFEFPADHGPHPPFRTEWWYVTGNLETPDGRPFGYQLTFFRFALRPDATGSPSPWATSQAYMAHFALTDPDAGRFRTAERFARGAVGLAGARARPFRVWLEDWSLTAAGEGAFPVRLRAAADSAALDLRLERGKAPVLQGDDGLSRKGPEPGNASYYYSLPRMPTEGRLVSGADTFRVRGLSWMDREWGTSALGPGVEGWDWFALQLDGGRELTYYRLRRPDGTAAPESRGTWIAPDGSARTLTADQLRLEPRRRWESPEDGVRYPVAWSMEVPSEGLDLVLEPLLDDQEWRGAFRYWEGAVRVRGRRGDEPVGGRGYVELTGYGEAEGRAGR